MNERLKAARIALGLTQTEFGRRLGVTNPAISKLELGNRNLTDQMVLAICREFSINEEWLRTGNGEMFKQESGGAVDDKFAALAAEYGLTDLQVELIRTILKFPDNTQKSVVQFICDLADAVSGDDEASVSGDAEIDAEVESYRKELLQEKRAEEKSLASGDTSGAKIG